MLSKNSASLVFKGKSIVEYNFFTIMILRSFQLELAVIQINKLCH